MNNKQRIAIISPLAVMVVMYPVFQFLARAFGETIGWYIGLIFYWLIWGAAFPWLMIGMKTIQRIIQPQKLNTRVFFLVLFPLLMAALYKFIPGMEYEKPGIWIFILLLSTNVGNGFFEEVL